MARISCVCILLFICVQSFICSFTHSLIFSKYISPVFYQCMNTFYIILYFIQFKVNFLSVPDFILFYSILFYLNFVSVSECIFIYLFFKSV